MTPEPKTPTFAEVNAVMAELFAKHDHLTAYRLFEDWYVARDPQAAVGGLWEEIGTLQLEYLKKHGLRPSDRLLDFGCGTLRAGRKLIRYLDAGRYTGIDISPGALAYAESLIRDEGLADKRPRLLLNDGLEKLFANGETYDVILAQSVFTHLYEAQIEDILDHIRAAMSPETRFFFTYNDAPSFVKRNASTFRYPFSYFEGAAAKFGLRAEQMTDYAHPRAQTMVIATRVRP